MRRRSSASPSEPALEPRPQTDRRSGRGELRPEIRDLSLELELSRCGNVGRPPGLGGRRRTAARGQRTGADRGIALATPADAGEVDPLERFGDLVVLTELVDRLPAALERAVVVDDQVAAGSQARIERVEREP